MHKEAETDRIDKALRWVQSTLPTYFKSDKNRGPMVEETVNTETLRGTFGGDTPGGVAQITEGTFNDLKNVSPKKHPKTWRRMQNANGIDFSKVKYEHLSKNPHLSMLFAALKYMTIPEPIPDTKRGRAKYWVDYYNTEDGKGTIERYLRDNRIHGK